jgi:hypothetical protein
MAPHVDPLMDQSFWHGLLWLFLMLVNNFLFPNYTDWQTLFQLPTYPTNRGFLHFTRQQYQLLWLAFFSNAHVHVAKLTHIWRGQGEQELDEDGVPISSISRMTGHALDNGKKTDGPTKSQSQSYITNPPTDAVVGHAGGNWRNPREHCPPREMVAVSDDLMRSLPQVAMLMENYELAITERRKCKTHKEIQEKRLYTTCGTLGSILNDIRSVFRCLASRPVNPKSRLLESASGTLFDLLKDSVTLRDVLSHEVFKSPLFKDLCDQVKAAEDRNTTRILQAHQTSEENRYLAQGLNQVLARTEMLVAWSEDHGRRNFSMTSTTHLNTDEQPTDGNVIDLPLPANEDTLADSDQQRKRRRAIDQGVAIASEPRVSNVPRPILSGVDNNHKTYRAFICDYIDEWRPLEMLYGNEWQIDKPLIVRQPDGTTKMRKQNTRAAWYNVRRPMYEYFEFTVASGATIEEAIEHGELIYKSARLSDKQERPALKDVKKKFIAELQFSNVRGEQACVGSRASILRDEVTDALETFRNDNTVDNAEISIPGVPMQGSIAQQPQVTPTTFAEAFNC